MTTPPTGTAAILEAVEHAACYIADAPVFNSAKWRRETKIAEAKAVIGNVVDIATTDLQGQNATLRAAQKACETCDGPTMAEVEQLRAKLAEACRLLEEPNEYAVFEFLRRIQEKST